MRKTIYQWKSTRQLCAIIFVRNTFNVFLAKIITKTTNSLRSWGHGAQRCAAILFYHKLGGNCSNCLYSARWWIPVVCFHLVTLLPCHLVTLSPCHLVALSPCHLVTLSSARWWIPVVCCHLGGLLGALLHRLLLEATYVITMLIYCKGIEGYEWIHIYLSSPSDKKCGWLIHFYSILYQQGWVKFFYLVRELVDFFFQMGREC